ncbi:MAG: hypothetical protein H0V17_16180, partial [Deltaproteobacteria bacterium]|nr:hypothetical protein [Deltaproteobacteria bacterium]
MRVIVSIAIMALAACGNDPDSCKITCSADVECPDGQTCGDLGRCTAGESCTEGSCTAGVFLGCVDEETARFCDQTGTAATSDACGGFGCNAAEVRCNECRPDQLGCAGDELTTCTADGLVASTETCVLQCADATGDTAARCHSIVPVWIPQVCETIAVEAELLITTATEIDTNQDSACNGGIVAQPSGPEICVVRYHRIVLGATVSVVGARAIAFVADQELDIDALLDVGARGRTSGPGSGGTSGGISSTGGGGGAGSKQVGGNGGAFGAPGGGGGAIVDPLGSPVLLGGQRANNNATTVANFGDYVPVGGGGGGAALLVSCSGVVTVSGTIDAGGGGGAGGGRKAEVQGSPFQGGAGGGAGGYV